MEMPFEIYKTILNKFEQLPYKERGIKITQDLVMLTITLLNASEGKILPQNSRKDILEKTPYGLDRLIKEKLPTTQMTATIISDILKDKGIVKVVKIPNQKTGKMIKATVLLEEFTW
jgi:hypothetical protein